MRPPTATVIQREVHGEQQIVVVCERCEEIRVLKVADAMRVALNVFLTEHDAERHTPAASTEPPAPAQRYAWRRNEDGTYTSNTEQPCGTCATRGTVFGRHGIPLHLGWCQPDQLFEVPPA